MDSQTFKVKFSEKAVNIIGIPVENAKVSKDRKGNPAYIVEASKKTMQKYACAAFRKHLSVLDYTLSQSCRFARDAILRALKANLDDLEEWMKDDYDT